METRTGKVVTLCDPHGYGFIRPDLGGPDVYFRYECLSLGAPYLRCGLDVRYKYHCAPYASDSAGRVATRATEVQIVEKCAQDLEAVRERLEHQLKLTHPVAPSFPLCAPVPRPSLVPSSAANVRRPPFIAPARCMRLFCGSCGGDLLWDLHGVCAKQLFQEGAPALTQRGMPVFTEIPKCMHTTEDGKACGHKVQVSPKSVKCAWCKQFLKGFDPRRWKCTNAECDYSKECAICKGCTVRPACSCPRLHGGVAGQTWGAGPGKCVGYAIVH